ncbi:MAG: hypothetical protein GXO24_03575 [Chlorobi bacterium]|nr:hypothetical protein [Chlorobiota bacterium]
MKKLVLSLILTGWFLQASVAQEYTHFSSNYFIGNSSYSLHKGEGYYANTLILFNDFYYGLSDNFSVGAGFFPGFLFGGGDTPIWFKLKLATPLNENFHVSGGVSLFTVVGEEVLAGIQLVPYLGFTVGGPYKNISMNGYILTGFDEVNAIMLNLSGKIPISPRTHLMADLFFPVIDQILLPATVDIVGFSTGFQGLSLDYGLIIPLVNGMERFVAIPYIGVKVPF